MPNTLTPGTTTYYAACPDDSDCRRPVDFVIEACESFPQATGVTINAGGSDELTSSTVCAPSAATVSNTGSGGASFTASYADGVPISITVPAEGTPGGIPLGATVSGVTVEITYTSSNGSWRSELRTRVTPPAGYNPQVSDIQPKTNANGTPPGSGGVFTGLIDPNSNPTTAPAWPATDPAGTWLFEFRETTDDGGAAVQDANITNITINVTYASTAVEWYTSASGGSPIGSGSSFNPVGVEDSGLPNTFTPGTTIFYAACADNPTCRTAASFVILPCAPPETFTVTGGGILCTTEGTGVVVGLNGSQLGATYQLFLGVKSCRRPC